MQYKMKRKKVEKEKVENFQDKTNAANPLDAFLANRIYRR